MDSYANRLTSILSTFTAMLAIGATLNYASSFFYTQRPTGQIEVTDIVDLTLHPYLQADQSYLDLSIKADFSSAFQWNTHQLFTYVTASYNTTEYPSNDVVIWDAVVPDKKSAVFNLQATPVKYPLRSVQRDLRGRDIMLTLAYRYMPLVGAMKEYRVTTTQFKMPSKYFSSRTHRDYYDYDD